MFTISGMPSTASSLFSAYASFAGSIMLVRSMANELVPGPIRSYLESTFRHFFTPLATNLTIVVDEFIGVSRNEVFDAAEIYLRTKINRDTTRFKVGKTTKHRTLNVSVERDEEIVDTFHGFKVKWVFATSEPQNLQNYGVDKRLFTVTFSKKWKDIVLDEYLPFVLARSKEIDEGDKEVRLFTTSCPHDYEYGGNGVWGSIYFDHPSTFDTLAMEPEMKKTVMEDLERFVRRRDFYRKVGKAWKRGYLLYGPPGTGKSSLIAAMANYLKFDVYDLELTSMEDNSELRRALLNTTNKSILVIEDIDCNAEMHDRDTRVHDNQRSDTDTKLTLSGLLNFIDGLWSSIGDERIIIFTTNHKDRLDPALLRPGRMDMHIHMSYCTNSGFRVLALNYLGLGDNDNHQLFDKIKGLIEEVQVTPAQLAEELMKSENVDVALQGVVDFLKRKKDEAINQHDENRDGVVTAVESEIKETELKRVRRFDRNIMKSLRYVGRGFSGRGSRGRSR